VWRGQRHQSRRENTPVFCFLPKRESLRLDESLTFALMLFGLGLPRCANFAFGMLNGCGERKAATPHARTAVKQETQRRRKLATLSLEGGERCLAANADGETERTASSSSWQWLSGASAIRPQQSNPRHKSALHNNMYT